MNFCHFEHFPLLFKECNVASNNQNKISERTKKNHEKILNGFRDTGSGMCRMTLESAIFVIFYVIFAKKKPEAAKIRKNAKL